MLQPHFLVTNLIIEVFVFLENCLHFMSSYLDWKVNTIFFKSRTQLTLAIISDCARSTPHKITVLFCIFILVHKIFPIYKRNFPDLGIWLTSYEKKHSESKHDVFTLQRMKSNWACRQPNHFLASSSSSFFLLDSIEYMERTRSYGLQVANKKGAFQVYTYPTRLYGYKIRLFTVKAAC